MSHEPNPSEIDSSATTTPAGRIENGFATGRAPSPAPLVGAGGEGDEPELQLLREILLGHYQQRAQHLETELHAVQAQIRAITLRIEDEQLLIDTVTPVMANSIRQSIHDSKGEMVEALYPIMAESIQHSIEESKDEMVEALYPIMGRLVSRSVSEAMRDLARRIDEQMRDTFSPANILRRLQAQVSGVSQAELAMRSVMPFHVRRIFLIERESGLLLHYLSATGEDAADSDVIGGMLTAIRDFVADAFGRGLEGELDAIRYGDRTILIETATRTYMAVVVEGIVPFGYQAEIRQQLYQLEEAYGKVLRNYDGNAHALAGAATFLLPLIRGDSNYRSAEQATTIRASKPQGHISGSAALVLIVATLLLLAGAVWILRLTLVG